MYTDVHFWTVYFKRLTESMFYDMPLLKILNVSERTGMAVVLISNKFFVRKIDAIRPEQDAVTAHV